MTLSIGDNIGAYRITEQLGQGGMATVFKAYHAALDRYVAIKVLHAAFTSDSTFLARFQREARVVAKLEHPNIVPVYDYAEFNGSPYLVMKFIEGETLKARLARGPLAPAETRQVISAVGAALDYAHRQGILHRDIKPSNIMLARDGSLYLADFGLARIAQAGESTLSADSMLGTPAYMSPEQARGIKDLDVRADIYSFGVVAYELTVGRVPFSGETAFSVVHDHIFTPPPAPHFVNPQVPEAVERVLLRALSKDRAERYDQVAAFVSAFLEATGGSADTNGMPSPDPTRLAPAEAASLTATPAEITLGTSEPIEPPVSAPAPTPRTSRTSAWVWVGAGGVAVMVLVALVGLGLLSWRNQQLRAQATQAQRTSTAVSAMTADGRDRRTATALAQNPMPELIAATAVASLQSSSTPAAAVVTPLPARTPPITPAGMAVDTAALLAAAGQDFDNHDSTNGFSLLDQAVQTNPTNATLLLRAGDTALAHGTEFARRALDNYYLPANALEAAHKDGSASQVITRVGLAMYALAADADGGTYLTGLAQTYSPAMEPRLFFDRWRIFSQTDLAPVESDLAQQLNSLLPRLVRGDLLLRQKKLVQAETDYTSITNNWTATMPLWELKEAQCEAKNIRQNRANATLKVTCEPVALLITGP